MLKPEHQQFSVRAIADLDELADCAAFWNELFRRSGNASPMQSFGWTYEFLRWKSRSSTKWTCFAAESNSRWLGILTVVEGNDGGTKAKILSALTDGHLNICDLLVDDSAQDAVIEEIFLFALGHFPKIAYLALPRVPSYSETMDFVQRNTKLNIVVRGRASDGSYLAPVSDVEVYEKSLSTKFKSNLARARRKMAQLGDPEFEVIANSREVGKSLQRFAHLEGSGWKGREGTSLNRNPDLLQFYESALGHLSKEGFVEWLFLKVGETDLAAQLAFRLDTRLVLWKMGYDESQKKLSPGVLLRQEIIRWESGKDRSVEIDATTTHDWHRNWQMSSRRYYRLRIYNKKTLAGLATYFRDRTIVAVSHVGWLSKVYRLIRR